MWHRDEQYLGKYYKKDELIAVMPLKRWLALYVIIHFGIPDKPKNCTTNGLLKSCYGVKD